MAGKNKEIFASVISPILVGLIFFISYFYYFDFPQYRALADNNREDIKRIEFSCSEIHKEIKDDLKIIKEDIKNILIKL